MRLYFPVDLTGNLIMIEKLVLGEIWTGDLQIFNPDALTSVPSWQAICHILHNMWWLSNQIANPSFNIHTGDLSLISWWEIIWFRDEEVNLGELSLAISIIFTSLDLSPKNLWDSLTSVNKADDRHWMLHWGTSSEFQRGEDTFKTRHNVI